ncbi:hypothetical protein M422DRAFT_264329 [Sphaerobolus stellatus SS14]|uniref:Replication termination factor 2 n=1 Tax=Sphaerobolus stellatus (strain SS14) TaxID=990650 RepID=A0A0C9UWQ7_SPHS4|nr:hypothetical protein M422DRAFT_264329 [Sphaerobolus stellatus SS14]
MSSHTAGPALVDVNTLKFKLTPNPSQVPEGADAETHGRLICPLTLKEMCGGVPFLYLGTCGCVFSEAGLRSIATSPAKDDDEKDIWPNALPNSPWQGFNRSEPGWGMSSKPAGQSRGPQSARNGRRAAVEETGA